MAKLRAILGYAWAALALPVVLATFMGWNFFSTALVDVTGVKVSPKFVGTDVAFSIPHDGGRWRTDVRPPAFPALIGESAEGFVQVDWVAEKEKGPVPAVLDEAIDYNRDGQPDFQLHLDTACRRAVVTSQNPNVLGRPEVYKIHQGWAVRVWVRNPAK